MAKKSSKKSKPVERSFEESLAALETIVEKLERGEEGITESLRHYETGVGLLRECHFALDQVEQKIQILTQTDDGLANFSEFDLDQQVKSVGSPTPDAESKEAMDGNDRLF